MVGFYQCIAAVPSVFNVVAPSGLEQYTQWLKLLELPSDFGLDLVVRAACFGSYRNRVWISSCWPIVFLLVGAGTSVGWTLLRERCKNTGLRVFHGDIRAAARTGIQRILPLVLVVTFVLVPSTSTRIFKTYLCDAIEYDGGSGETRRYLYDDLTTSCDTEEYRKLQATAFVFVLVWPVG
eukprot:423117-Prymnesium_polylepis.1